MRTSTTEMNGCSVTMPSATPAARMTARNPQAMSSRRMRAVMTSGRFGDVQRHVNCAAAPEASHATAMASVRAAGNTAATLSAITPTASPSQTARWASHSRVSPQRRNRIELVLLDLEHAGRNERDAGDQQQPDDGRNGDEWTKERAHDAAASGSSWRNTSTMRQKRAACSRYA